MEYRGGVLYDADGVLLDSLKHGLTYYPSTAKALGLEVPSREAMIKVWGLKWEDFLNALWPQEDINEFVRAFDAKYHELGYHKIVVPAVRGADEVVGRLKKMNFWTALITNRQRHSVEHRFGEAGIGLDLFDFIQAVDEYVFCKPDPRVFNRASEIAKSHRIEHSKIWFVGDTVESDWAAAREAGLNFIGVLTGPTSRVDFLAAGVADENILESVRDLPCYLDKLG